MRAAGVHLVMSNTVSGQKCHIGTTFNIISCFSYSTTLLLLLFSSPLHCPSFLLTPVTAHFLSPFPFSFSSLSSRHLLSSSSPSLLPLSLSLRHLSVDRSPFCLPLLLSVIRHFVTSLASFPSFVSLPLLPFLSSSSSSSASPSLSDVI